MPHPLPVTLSVLTVDPGGMGGGETYARALTRLLVPRPGEEDLAVQVLVPENARGFSEGVPELVAEGVRSGAGHRRRAIGMLQALLRTPALHRLLGREGIVYFPFTVPLPFPSRRQGHVQMLFDLQHRDLPELFPRVERVFRRLAYEATARRADAIITISAFTKGRIVELLGIPEERIHVSHLGVDTERFRPHLGERDDFIFYPARAWPHKNHARLFEAVRLLRSEGHPLRLVLTGGDLDRLGPLPEGVEWRGHVTPDELAELYRRAAVLAFPSLYEGFGFPPVEAMASGCPVAAADSGSLPEICGDAAVYVDPLDPRSIADGILEAIARAAELGPRGIERARLFSWERCRDEHLAVFRAVARQRGARGRRR
ncbi:MULTISPECIES: glycosyltransferase family 4 protein [unclassified Rathayibacter]|uniref:glycosyltransferase family 4 protein n=1 Tax=unclassified Rathayibacter TaxID=2609250 RepID=UPI00188AEAB2|nr:MULTISPECIES: glycosyltransferase family 1 protein [unclassified Rathayibacter]MBF4463351.1 glycosyltransferase family 4 protein [Rathayibacter sp. VKM Ac-2879]MBF4504926.1 glycosyltransferase family 4 protein [Rathayibacter sp. VKM Ac-2878]